ncbi:MAG: ABC-2 transporter permease [Methanosarcinales archaeon]|nr:MAG: ABC-2 transporter permease [Methanosarcinales archaeon]
MALTGSVIKKDLKVYIRHKKTLMLIFIAPILIMVLIGSVFSGPSEGGVRDVKLGVGGGSEQGKQIIEELNKSSMFIIVEENTTDPAVIEEGVRKGRYSAGIFIPEDETQSLKLFLDNSRVQIAPVISTAFLSTTEKMSYELTFGFISKLWKNLKQMESELKPLKEGVLMINRSITSLNRDTSNVLSSMDEIDVKSLNESIMVMKNSLEQMRIDLLQSADDINATRQELRDLDRNVSSIQNDTTELRDDLKYVVDNIDAADASMQDVQSQMHITYNLTCSIDPSTQQCISMALAIRQLGDTRALMLEKTGRIKTLHSNLVTISEKSAELHEKLEKTDLKLQKMQESIIIYTSEISNMHGNISNIENTVAALADVKNQSSIVSSQMEKLTAEMGNSSSALTSDIDRTGLVIGEVIARSPAVIAAPINLDRVPVFRGRSFLDFLMPGIISIVLMFISFLLASITIVQERSKKTLIRTLLTPLSLGMFLFEKTAALIIIAFIQGIIMLIVAFVFYGILIPTDQLAQLFLIILVYAAAFIGIGMALATLAESENTAMLLTLVLSIPMLFLSGVFFPFETMPDLMILLGNALPITMGIRALEAVLIYQKGFDAFYVYLIPLLVYGLAGIGTAYILLRKEITD